MSINKIYNIPQEDINRFVEIDCRVRDVAQKHSNPVVHDMLWLLHFIKRLLDERKDKNV